MRSNFQPIRDRLWFVVYSVYLQQPRYSKLEFRVDNDVDTIDRWI